VKVGCSRSFFFQRSQEHIFTSFSPPCDEPHSTMFFALAFSVQTKEQCLEGKERLFQQEAPVLPSFAPVPYGSRQSLGKVAVGKSGEFLPSTPFLKKSHLSPFFLPLYLSGLSSATLFHLQLTGTPLLPRLLRNDFATLLGKLQTVFFSPGSPASLPP